MTLADAFLYGTAWVSLLGWACTEWLRASSPSRARLAFTLGLVALAAHAVLAFHLRHGWSHASALADTARRTEEVMGLPVAAGLYVNYAFLCLWAAEAGWWWGDPFGYRSRPRVLAWSVRGAFLFMFVNGAFVFATPATRVVGALSILAVGRAWYRESGAGDGHG